MHQRFPIALRVTPRFAAAPLATALLLAACALAPASSLASTRHHDTQTTHHATTSHPSSRSTSHGTHHATVHHTSARSSSHHRTHESAQHEVAMGIPHDRATQIQSALIKQGYLNGEPTGNWDTQTISAMQKMQSDNGWQTKTVPDARALIKLGLGPNDDAEASVRPSTAALPSTATKAPTQTASAHP
jgi:hypothetical protein